MAFACALIFGVLSGATVDGLLVVPARDRRDGHTAAAAASLETEVLSFYRLSKSSGAALKAGRKSRVLPGIFRDDADATITDEPLPTGCPAVCDGNSEADCLAQCERLVARICGYVCEEVVSSTEGVATCEEMQESVCDLGVTFQEAETKETSDENDGTGGGLQIQPIFEPVEDQLEPIDAAAEPELWSMAVNQGAAAFTRLNLKRAQLGLTAMEDSQVLHGWTQVQEGTGFKLCMSMAIDREVTYVTVDTSNTNINGVSATPLFPNVTDTSGILITGVHPMSRVLGHNYEMQEQLEINKDEPSTNIDDSAVTSAMYPCHPNFTMFLAESLPKLGDKRMKSASLIGRSYRHVHRHHKGETLPTHFNSREAWAGCALPVRDQGGCGACYSFAASAVAGERLCIARVEAAMAGDILGGSLKKGANSDDIDQQKAAKQEEIKQLEEEQDTLNAAINSHMQEIATHDTTIKAHQDRLSTVHTHLVAAREELEALAGSTELLQRGAPQNKTSAAAAPVPPRMLRAAPKAGGEASFSTSGSNTSKKASSALSRFAVPLSTQELVSCGSSERPDLQTPYCMLGPGGVPTRKYAFGCQGGTPFNALYWAHVYGLPTKDCVPYHSGGGSFKDHFEWEAGKVEACAAIEERPCHAARQQYKLERPERIRDGDVESMMRVIYTSGPVYISMNVHRDFMNYKKNAYMDDVYFLTPSSPRLGGHALILDGWGMSASSIPFWHGRNSWGAKWGLDGLFRLKRGDNTANVEAGTHFARPVSAGAGREEVVAGSPCIAVHQEGSTCSLTNVCAGVRSVRFSYLGTPSNCGSWEGSLPQLRPGESAKYIVQDAMLCTVTEDEALPADEAVASAAMYYQDITAKFAKQGYSCVLKNTYTGAGTRLRCCGTHCSSVGAGQAASFPSHACQDGCREAYGKDVHEITQ